MSTLKTFDCQFDHNAILANYIQEQFKMNAMSLYYLNTGLTWPIPVLQPSFFPAPFVQQPVLPVHVPQSDLKESQKTAEAQKSTKQPTNSRKIRAYYCYSFEVTEILEKRFEVHNHICGDELKGLAEEVNLTTRQVIVWFQNRRARAKKEAKPRHTCIHLKNISKAI